MSVFSHQLNKTRQKAKEIIVRSEAASELAQKEAARYDLLLPEEAG